jgi:CheY-like chemotaxis protein/anti-sigma regulatory factor (Ser/Thr protein kinase)
MLAEGSVSADVAVVGNVDAALGHLERGAVDLIVVDLAVSGRQGLELVTDIRANPDWQDLPVIVLSGVTDPDMVRRTYASGANCFVRKPRRVVELAPTVRAIEQYWTHHGRSAPRDDKSVFQLPLAATPDSVREAREVVRRLVDGWGLGSLGDAAELCTHELAANAVLHARSPVLLGVSLLDSGLRVEVEDESPGPLEAGSLEGSGETGRGLALVDAFSACWGVIQHVSGKTVWFELRRPPEPA